MKIIIKANCQNVIFVSSRARTIEIKNHFQFSVNNQLRELQQTTSARITSLEEEILLKRKEYGQKLQNVTDNFQTTLADRDAALVAAKSSEDDLLQQIKTLRSTENELREKVLASETEFSERLQFAAIRERELNDKYKSLKETLSKELSSANNEILVLRSPAISKEQASSRVSKQQQPHPDEIQSWRSVLEMKQTEISDLQKRNRELENSAAALPSALAKISGLESRLEDLTIQLKIKIDEEQ